MKIRYTGGRSRYEVTLNRKSYHFTPENEKILETEDQALVNFIFGLPNRGEFEVLIEKAIIPPPPPVTTPKIDPPPQVEPPEEKKDKNKAKGKGKGKSKKSKGGKDG